MDRASLRQHLADIDVHIADGERHILKQERMVADLDEDGHDTKDALAILETLRETRALHIQRRDLLLRQLD